MNRYHHLLVFNRARGLQWAVALSLSSPLTSPQAWSQIVADPSAPGNQRPTVLSAPNGVPLVNIQTPSAAGVSRNTYRQFDVGTPGAILNNSRTSAPTQLGGFIPGNPWLATGPARVILNEVNSAHPSYLNGPIEVAGQRAEVVVAIYSDGDIRLGGAIDLYAQASGQAQAVNNLSADIEAIDDIALSSRSLRNERRNVNVTQVNVIDQTAQLDMPSWWVNGPNKGSATIEGTSNHVRQHYYLLDPASIAALGDLHIGAGRDVTARAASVQALGDVSVQAGRRRTQRLHSAEHRRDVPLVHAFQRRRSGRPKRSARPHDGPTTGRQGTLQPDGDVGRQGL